MDILFYLKQKNLIFLVLVSIISFYILRIIDCCTDTIYPYIHFKLNIKEKGIINYDELIKLLIKIILVFFIVIILVNYL